MNVDHVELFDSVDDLFELGGGQRTGLTEYEHLLSEGDERGDRGDTEHPSQLLLVFGVYLGEDCVGVSFAGRLEYRPESTARAAPGSPEVDEDDVVVLDRLSEIVLGQGQRWHRVSLFQRHATQQTAAAIASCTVYLSSIPPRVLLFVWRSWGYGWRP